MIENIQDVQATHTTSHKVELYFVITASKFEFWYTNDTYTSDRVALPLDSPKIDTEFKICWILSQLKPLLYNNLPCSNIGVSVDNRNPDESNLAIVEHIKTLVERTNALVQQVKSLNTAHHDKILFYNSDEGYLFKNYYERVAKKDASKLLYASMKTGWNEMKRTFADPPSVFSPEELIQYIMQNNIRTIVANNTYFLETTVNHSLVHMMAVLKAMGVEYISCDIDSYDLFFSGPFRKSWTHCNDMRRFSCSPHADKLWDQYMKNENIEYIPLIQSLNPSTEINRLKEDYEVLFISNSRIDLLSSQMPQVLYLLEKTREDHSYEDLQELFFTLKYILVFNENIRLIDRLDMHAHLTVLFLNCLTFLKYKTIDDVKTDRPVKLFGDEGWGKIFPQYYQNKYLSRTDAVTLLAQKRHLHVLFNQNYAYLDANPVIINAIAVDTPFINFPSFTKSADFEAFSQVEYDGAGRLNELIENVNAVFERDDVKKSVHSFKNKMNECQDNFADLVLADPKSGRKITNRFVEYHVPDALMAEQKIMNRLQNGRELINELLNELFVAPSGQFKAEHSRYFNRDFTQKLLHIKK